jgi:hypothetical protein
VRQCPSSCLSPSAVVIREILVDVPNLADAHSEQLGPNYM